MGQTRRRFISSLGPAFASILVPARRARAIGAVTGPHPKPRPGIDGSRVLTADGLAEHPDAIPVFDMVRQIPQIADGIRCQCDCHNVTGYRSLLVCYEGEGMAAQCQICQGQAKLAFRMHRQGHTLDEIRTAIDEEFG
jgi:hypothetical protein